MNAPDWRHRAQAADDLLADIAAVCRGEMPAEPREGGSEAHRAAWEAVCALVAEVTDLRAAPEGAWKRRPGGFSIDIVTRAGRVEHARKLLRRINTTAGAEHAMEMSLEAIADQHVADRVELHAEIARLRAAVAALRASAPPEHPSDYGHEVWSAALRDAEALGWQGMRAAQAEVDAGRAHTLALEQQNISLLRWQSVASDAHVDHLCRIIRSLAVSDETPRVLRDLSAMGVEDEVRRAVNAERINREKSELSAREWRKKAEDAEADLLTERAEDARKERAAVVTFLRAEAGDYAVGEAPLDSADAIERGEHRRKETE